MFSTTLATVLLPRRALDATTTDVQVVYYGKLLESSCPLLAATATPNESSYSESEEEETRQQDSKENECCNALATKIDGDYFKEEAENKKDDEEGEEKLALSYRTCTCQLLLCISEF
jgi:hypothetical protein